MESTAPLLCLSKFMVPRSSVFRAVSMHLIPNSLSKSSASASCQRKDLSCVAVTQRMELRFPGDQSDDLLQATLGLQQNRLPRTDGTTTSLGALIARASASTSTEPLADRCESQVNDDSYLSRHLLDAELGHSAHHHARFDPDALATLTMMHDLLRHSLETLSLPVIAHLNAEVLLCVLRARSLSGTGVLKL